MEAEVCCLQNFNCTLFVIHLKYLSSTVNYDMSTAKELLLLTNSPDEQQRWVSHLLKRIPRKHPTMSPPAAIQNTPHEATSRSSPRVSPHPSPRSSPRMSAHRGAIKIQPSRPQQPSGKPRWGRGKFCWKILRHFHILMQNLFLESIALCICHPSWSWGQTHYDDAYM